MQTTDQVLICLTTTTGGRVKSRTQIMYGTVTNAEYQKLKNDSETTLIGHVLFDQVRCRPVVKTASGFSDLKEWKS